MVGSEANNWRETERQRETHRETQTQRKRERERERERALFTSYSPKLFPVQIKRAQCSGQARY